MIMNLMKNQGNAVAQLGHKKKRKARDLNPGMMEYLGMHLHSYGFVSFGFAIISLMQSELSSKVQSHSC